MHFCKKLVPITMIAATTLAFAQPSTDTPSIYAFTSVHLVRPDSDEVIPNQTVLVRDDKIAEIGDAATVDIPEAAIVIPGAGAYLMPGLAEMHTHLPPPKPEDPYLQDIFYLWLANGVTTIRGMLFSPGHLELKGQIEQGVYVGPRLYTAGRSLNRSSVKSVEQAQSMVREQAAAGYDFVKMHPGLTLEQYDAIAATAREENIAFVGHISEDVGLWHALERGQDSIEHLDGYVLALVAPDVDTSEIEPGPLGIAFAAYFDADRIALLAKATADAGVWNSPTETVSENWIRPQDLDELRQRPEYRYLPAKTVRGWFNAKRGIMKAPLYDPELAQRTVDYRRELIKALHDAGAGLILGSDAPQILNVPGFSTQRELGLLVESGLTPAQAITTGTKNAAVFLGQETVFGAVDTGLSADLVLLQDNPLEDIRNLASPLGVMVRGQWLSRDDLDRELDAIAARYAP